MANTPKRKRTLLYGLLGLLVILVALAAWKARTKPKGEPVAMEAVQRHTIREKVSASGKIFPETEVKISSDVSGEIIALYVREGDSVRAGQVLARIQPDQYETAVARTQQGVNLANAQRSASQSSAKAIGARLEQLKANKRAATARLDQAKSAYTRSEKLLREGVISQQEFETATSNLRSSESDLAAVEANLSGAENELAAARANAEGASFQSQSSQISLREQRINLQRTEIRAPVSGIVSKLNVEKGERVVGTLQMAGTEMMRIANLTSMEVQVDVSENDILKVALNDEVDIEVDAYLGRIFKGKVSEIANSASNVGVGSAAALNTDQVTNFIIKIRVDPNSYSDLVGPNKQYPFRPGMSASVDIYTNTADNVVAVPIMAVTAREEEQKKPAKDEEAPTAQNVKEAIGANRIKEIVFVVVGDTVTTREVVTGIQDNKYMEIKTGLTEGETVVTGPYSAISRKLKGGARVTKQKMEKDKDKKEE